MSGESITSLMTSSGDLIADRRYRFGRDLFGRGDFAAAADLFAQAIEAAPEFAPAWFALGEARAKLGDGTGAAAALHRALAIDPDDRCGAALHLARLGVTDMTSAMSPTYVRALFDQYAPRFEEALQGLAYQGPARLREAVANACPDVIFNHMLDLGCGTGMAGAALRPQVRRLTGVDLSSAMVAQARAKNIYDRLETGDLLQFLLAEHGNGRVYDLVVAADVFVYVFDLAPVATAVAKTLSPGGLFAFTVETHQGSGVELGHELRYRHGIDYIRRTLEAAGLRVQELSRVATRTEAGENVPGLLALAV